MMMMMMMMNLPVDLKDATGYWKLKEEKLCLEEGMDV
jgi:hypothetical protein